MTHRITEHRIVSASVFLAVFLAAIEVAARTVVECREADGSLSFRDHCPPNEAKTGEKRLRNAPKISELSAAQLAKTTPVILYSVPNCDACDLIRLQLQSRTIPFTEKDVSSNAVTQQELQTASGALTVPTVLIGDKAQAGYDRAALNQRLTEVGFKPATAPAVDAVDAKGASN